MGPQDSALTQTFISTAPSILLGLYTPESSASELGYFENSPEIYLKFL